MTGDFNTGLVLEGGGTRAIFTSGVLDSFIEASIQFPYVIGVSAGACNGASFIGKSFRRQHDITINYVNDKRYMGVGNIIRHGEYLNSDWIFNDLSYDICPLNQDEYEKSNTVFCTVATNAKTGKAEYMYPKSLRAKGCPEIRASCSLPGATKGCEINGELYFDGGLVDSIPLERAYDDGCKKAVVILTQHHGFVKKPMNEKLKGAFKKYPKIGEDIVKRHIMYNKQLEFTEKMKNEGRAFVIQPAKPLECSTLEKNLTKLERIYQLGYEQGKQNTERIKKFISES